MSLSPSCGREIKIHGIIKIKTSNTSCYGTRGIISMASQRFATASYYEVIYLCSGRIKKNSLTESLKYTVHNKP
jgi:hypothetical protein